MILNNCSTWMEIQESTIDKLEELQNSLYRSLLNVPFTTPKAALIWEVGGTKMSYRIKLNKLVFMNHILHLGEDSLARQIQTSQETHNVGGLTQEVKQLIAELALPNCFEQRIPQNKWKSLVKKAIDKANEEEIRQAAKSSKKMKNRMKEGERFECKEYLSDLPLCHARIFFQHKYSMTEKVKMNYKGDPSFARTLWKCQKCGNQDTESHLLWCSGYSKEREDLDLESDKDLCKYLQKIIQQRCKENTN